ncbi:MAG: NUDIX hydrolase [bacterium]|nr:NUDIX hydrolase [bacterium]
MGHVDPGEEFSLSGKESLREIERVIVSAIIFSKDGKILMGRKDPKAGGVYPDSWHIPGGGIEEGESMEESLKREVMQETGIDISSAHVIKVPGVGEGVSEKTLKETGEKVLVHMQFNRFEVHLDKNADEIALNPNDDLVELQWFTPEDLMNIQQIPGGKEFFEQKGYMPKAEE